MVIEPRKQSGIDRGDPFTRPLARGASQERMRCRPKCAKSSAGVRKRDLPPLPSIIRKLDGRRYWRTIEAIEINAPAGNQDPRNRRHDLVLGVIVVATQ